ncbi:unnamed protein product [Mycena citricolor]|uniref:Uncharacterized protein n=1 Tax=Mycena citricolor TaxID=2018698 RepID=A0AAD2HAP1_9AGAR|nr:unnamed protein product [Mycena citricolor]
MKLDLLPSSRILSLISKLYHEPPARLCRTMCIPTPNPWAGSSLLPLFDAPAAPSIADYDTIRRYLSSISPVDSLRSYAFWVDHAAILPQLELLASAKLFVVPREIRTPSKHTLIRFSSLTHIYISHPEILGHLVVPKLQELVFIGDAFTNGILSECSKELAASRNEGRVTILMGEALKAHCC